MEEKDLALEKELKKFNWGAAYLGFIWSIVNRCFKKWFVHSLIVGLIAGGIGYVIGMIFFEASAWSFIKDIFVWSLTIILAVLAVFIYCGIKGNRWAWESLPNKDFESFHKTQKTLGIVAIVLLIFNILGVLSPIAQIYLLSKVSSSDKTTSNSSYVSSEVCKFVSEAFPVALKNTKDDEFWFENLEVELSKNENIRYAYVSKYSKHLLLSVSFEDKVLPSYVDFDIEREKPCSISEGNCYLSSPVADKEYACRFYFDDNGKVSPSKKTERFMNN